jgi:hypothetical protein
MLDGTTAAVEPEKEPDEPIIGGSIVTGSPGMPLHGMLEADGVAVCVVVLDADTNVGTAVRVIVGVTPGEAVVDGVRVPA